MKQYLLFTGSIYYPEGGWDDFKESYDTVQQAETAATTKYASDWYHIVDRETGTKLD